MHKWAMLLLRWSSFTLMSRVPFEPDMRTSEGAASIILTSSLLLAVGNRCHRTTTKDRGEQAGRRWQAEPQKQAHVIKVIPRSDPRERKGAPAYFSEFVQASWNSFSAPRKDSRHPLEKVAQIYPGQVPPEGSNLFLHR